MGASIKYKLLSIDGKRGVSYRVHGEGQDCFRLKIGKGGVLYFSKGHVFRGGTKISSRKYGINL